MLDENAYAVNTTRPKLLSVILVLNFVALLITFGLNFFGSPLLKYHYLIHVFITFFAIVLYEIPDIFTVILTLFFIEGQGRILWEYASWARVIFDIFLLIAIFKIFIRSRKIIDLKKIPHPLIIIIALHFLWYVVEFSNLYSVSYFAVLSASKLYIYPVLFFLGMSQLNFDLKASLFQKTLTFFIFLLALEIALAIFQFNMKEGLLLKISPYYFKAMTDGVYTGMLYRPFGTTQLPGAISSFLFLTVGLLFLKLHSKISYLIRMAILSASGFVIILCQVRSALIKFLLIIFIIHLGEIFYYRFKLKGFISLLPIIAVLFVASQYLSSMQDLEKTMDLAYVKDRISSLAEINKVRGSRINTAEFFRIVSTKLSENPLGLGPGLTGAAGSLSKELLVGNPFVNSGMTWTSDNILIALVIDFGYGAIFYILLLLYIPAYFFRFIIITYRDKDYDSYKALLVCFSSIIVIIIGNWGAIGITYNPESFVFWFFTALGFQTIATSRNREILKPAFSPSSVHIVK